MSEENVEIVRAAFEAFAAGDAQATVSQVAENVVCSTVAPLPDSAEYHGHDGYWTWVGAWAGNFEDLEIEPVQYLDLGDQVVVTTLQRGLGVTSGALVEARFWFVFALHLGQVVRMSIFGSESQALEAAGLRE